MRLYLGRETAHQKFTPKLAFILATSGLLAFMVIGLFPLATGGMFLDYGQLPIPGMPQAALRSLWILIVEIMIGLTVFGTIVLLFDNLVSEKR